MEVFARRSLLLAGVFAFLCGGPLYASGIMVFKVPFDFRVQGQQFPAGQYVVSSIDGSVMSITGSRGKTFEFFMTQPSGHDPERNTPALVFTRREKQIELSEIWKSGTDGRELPRQ